MKGCQNSRSANPPTDAFLTCSAFIPVYDVTVKAPPPIVWPELMLRVVNKAEIIAATLENKPLQLNTCARTKTQCCATGRLMSPTDVGPQRVASFHEVKGGYNSVIRRQTTVERRRIEVESYSCNRRI